jgi:hypothetical protein
MRVETVTALQHIIRGRIGVDAAAKSAALHLHVDGVFRRLRVLCFLRRGGGGLALSSSSIAGVDCLVAGEGCLRRDAWREHMRLCPAPLPPPADAEHYHPQQHNGDDDGRNDGGYHAAAEWVRRVGRLVVVDGFRPMEPTSAGSRSTHLSQNW